MAEEIPKDLVALLGSLQGLRIDPSRLLLSRVMIEIQQRCSAHLGRDDPLRLMMDSQDLAQEVYLDLAEAAALFRGRTWGEFYRFVGTVIEHQKTRRARHYRTKKRGGLAGEAELDEDVAAKNTPTPSTAMFQSEMKDRLKTLVQGLSEGERGPLELYLARVSYSEIAERLGISQETARKRVSRAVERLRERW